MSAYDDLILSDGPAVYPNTDIVGPASNGQVVVDRGPNAFNGSLIYTATSSEQAWGFPPAVETDAEARDFRGWSNAGLILGLSGTSRIEIPNATLLQPSNDCTVECWVRMLADIPLAGDFILTGKGGTVGIYVTFSGGTRLGGFLIDSGDNLFEVFDSTFVVTDYIGTPFYLAVFRLGNTLGLDINGSVRASTTITSGLSNKVTSFPYRIHPDTGFALGARYCKPAFYTYALTAPQRVAHFEAGINATLLNGYSNVVPSSILYSDEKKPPISFPYFRHNWDDPLIERISFLADNSKSSSGKTEGSQPMPTTLREIEISQILREDSERRSFRAKIWAHQDRKWFIPIREDFEQLQTPLSAGGNSIPVIPQYKDYEADSWIGIRQLNDAGQVIKSEVLEIQTLNSPTGPVITKTNLVNSYSAFSSYAYPVRRAYLERSIPIRGHSDAVEDLTIVARLLAEDEKLFPNRITPWTPTILRSGYEVFDPSVWQSNDWSEIRDYDVDREGQEIDFEVGAFETSSDTAGAEESFSYRFPIKGRDKHSEFLGWFYAREGSLNYLWVPTMQKDFKIVSVGGPSLTVEGTDYSENYALAEARRDLAFIYNDNTMVLRRVNSFSGSPNETLVLDFDVPTQTNLRSVSLLKFCQMDGNTLEIAKYTDDVWRFAWRFRELLFTP